MNAVTATGNVLKSMRYIFHFDDLALNLVFILYHKDIEIAFFE